MGGGDIKMMAMVGAFLGWQGTLLTMFLGALHRQPHLRAAGPRRATRSWCPSGSSSPSARRPPSCVGPAILGWYAGYLAGA